MKNQDNRKIIVLIPSLEPDTTLLSYVNNLKESGFTDIIIVNDGSGDPYRAIFQQLVEYGCTVLHHSKNLGKGGALKTGFQYIQDNYYEPACVVTADSDGQHAVLDVLRVSEESKESPDVLILGVRDFKTSGVPAKSLLGNRVASFIFKVLYGERLSDTQTGLRAFGTELLSFMLEVNGSGFEYELQMLIACVQASISMKTVPIQVIYENDNKGTHFKPFHDSFQIIDVMFSGFMRFSAASLVSSVVDLGIAWFLLFFLRFLLQSGYFRILAATVIARVISTGVNYLLNRKFVFQEKRADNRSLLRYALLSVLIILLSATGVYGLYEIFGLDEKIGKIICDSLLFLLSYRVQQRWVFAKERVPEGLITEEHHG